VARGLATLKLFVRPLFVAGAIAVGVASAPEAAILPGVTVITKHYQINGRFGHTGRALKRQMDLLGPKGFWAYTKWRLSWTFRCKVNLTITYTLPELRNRDQVPLPVRGRWDRMLKNLITHEKGHGQLGRNAARDVAAAHCIHGRRIVNHWSAQDKVYDTRTDHGLTQGVVMRD